MHEVSQRKPPGWIWRHRWHLLIIWIILFTIAVSLGVRDNRRRAQEGREAKIYLCAFKLNLIRQISAAEQFIHTHPNGFDGVSANDIQLSVNRQKATLKSVRGLNCED